MAGLNPDILAWARTTAGLDLTTAAHKIGLKAARGVAGADRLAALEAGDGAPTAAQLRKMAQQYRRPLLTFYLPVIPMPAEVGTDFRTLPDEGDPPNILLATLLRDVRARQSLVREALEDDEHSKEVALVGSQRGVKRSETLARSLVEAIGFERALYRGQDTAEDAFSYLRSIVEKAGVFVLLVGDCGSWQTAIDVQVFRGFAISDKLAPFIVINDQDAKSAWSFTLLHELAHILLGETGISGGAPQGDIEQLCNDTAAATLIEAHELANFPFDEEANEIAAINQLADRCRVSRSMVAYQLFRVGRLPEERWQALSDVFRAEWLAAKNAERERNRAKPEGPNWYIVRRHRLGSALLGVVRQGIADGSLTPTRAGRMLGVKPTSVYPLLAEPRRVRLA